MTENPGLIAGGNILPSVFCTMDGNSYEVVASVSGDHPIGISQVGTHDPPGVAGATAYAAVSGQELQVFTEGDVCLLTVATGVTAGQFLMPGSTNGYGIPQTTGNWYGAVALESVSAAVGLTNPQIRVKVVIGYR
jgi:hypothetical protein